MARTAASLQKDPRRPAALLARAWRWVALVAIAVLLGIVLLLIYRARSVTISVPEVYRVGIEQVFRAFESRPGAPRVRLLGYDVPGPGLLANPKPLLALVPRAPWVLEAQKDHKLASLSSGSFPFDPSRYPRALTVAAGSEDTATVSAIPLAFDPWVLAWHRDLLGGFNATLPRDWSDVTRKVLELRKQGATVLALPGKEPEADLAWLAVLASGRDLTGARDLFESFPQKGREALQAAFEDLARLQSDGLVQKSSFSYPWSDALNLLFQHQAAGILLPMSRFRGISPRDSAALIVSPVPDFPGQQAYAIVAELWVLVAPSRVVGAPGTDRAIAFLAEAATQRAMADVMGMVPARLDSPVRDGAASAAVQAARNAAELLSPSGAALSPGNAALAAAIDKTLRNPREVNGIVGELLAAQR